MLKALVSIIALATAIVPAAAAESTRSGGFADVVSRGLYDLDATAELKTAVGAIIVGSMTVTLEKTPLTEIAAHFHATVNNEGEAGEDMDWVCVGDAARTIWFMSDGEMGGGNLTIFAVEATAPEAAWNCGQISPDVTIDAGLPGLGASAADARAKAGPATAGPDGRFSYNGLAPVKTALGYPIYQDVVYEERDGVIVAFGIDQLSES